MNLDLKKISAPTLGSGNWYISSLGVYFERYSHWLFCFYCLWAGLSIAAAQMILIPLILSWVVFCLSSARSTEKIIDSAVETLAAPIVTWLALALLASVVGVNTLKALEELAKTTLSVMLPFCVYTSLKIYGGTPKEKLGRIATYVFLIVCSQSIAALHTVLEKAFGFPYLPKTPGGLTESGQIVLVLPLLIVVSAVAVSGVTSKIPDKPFAPLLTPLRIGECAVLLALFMLISWPQALNLPALPLQLACIALFALYLVFVWHKQPLNKLSVSADGFKGVDRWLQIAAMLMLTALMLNLKRGPWMGVAVELILLGLLLSKRLVFLVCLGGFVLLLLFEPARDRVFQIDDHFNIDGGRRYMWSLGSELVQRYPLGVGPDNSKYMQVIDPTLPHPHQHMHNNFLNVLVESGWLGLAAYLWWIYEAIKLGLIMFLHRFNTKGQTNRLSGLLALALSVSILGWQTAGLVEYNFGDGEIRLIGLFIMGLLLALHSVEEKEENS